MESHDAPGLGIAIRGLTLIIDREDSLYKPARFFLGFARLKHGDASDAEIIFASLMRPLDERALEVWNALKDSWPVTGIRFPRLTRHIRWLARRLRPWVELWWDITVSIRGSDLYVLADSWQKLKEFLAKRDKTPIGTDDRKRYEALVWLLVNSFRTIPVLHHHAKIVAGMIQEKTTPEQARAILDKFLDQTSILSYDQQLIMLEVDLAMMEFVEKGMHEEALQRLKALREDVTSLLFEEILTKLEQEWKAANWQECRKLLHEMRRHTQQPSEHSAGLLIRSIKLPKGQRWLIQFTIPAFSSVEKWRSSLREASYIESMYYRALAKYQSSDPAKLREALEEASALHSEHLAGPTPRGMNRDRREELRALAACLEIDAGVRISMSADSKDYFDTRLAGLGRKLPALVPELMAWLKSLESADVRASILRSLGLIARNKSAKGTVLNQYLWENVKLPIDEIGYLEQSRSLAASPETYLCIAESMLGREKANVQEASLYLEQAIRLCPHHARATALLSRCREQAG
jgi:hypothetical protein